MEIGEFLFIKRKNNAEISTATEDFKWTTVGARKCLCKINLYTYILYAYELLNAHYNMF